MSWILFAFFVGSAIEYFGNDPERKVVLSAMSQVPSPKREQIANTLIIESRSVGIDPLFVLANMRSESDFDDKAKSSKGCYGLMQLNPRSMLGFAKENGMASPNIKDIDTNIKIGVLYMKSLIDRWKKPKYVILAYNGGPGKLKSIFLSKKKIPASMNEHANRVIRRWQEYRQQLKQSSGEVQKALTLTFRFGIVNP